MPLQVDRIISAGATVMLRDGSMWNIPLARDREKTNSWLPSQEVEISGEQKVRFRFYLKNLARDETVTAERLK